MRSRAREILERIYRALIDDIRLDVEDRRLEVPIDVETMANIVESTLNISTEYFECGDPYEDAGIIGYIAKLDKQAVVL